MKGLVITAAAVLVTATSGKEHQDTQLLNPSQSGGFKSSDDATLSFPPVFAIFILSHALFLFLSIYLSIYLSFILSIF